MPPTALTRAKPTILPGRLLSWSAALALTTMAVSGYSLWIVRTLRRRNGMSARSVMGGR